MKIDIRVCHSVIISNNNQHFSADIGCVFSIFGGSEALKMLKISVDFKNQQNRSENQQNEGKNQHSPLHYFIRRNTHEKQQKQNPLH